MKNKKILALKTVIMNSNNLKILSEDLPREKLIAFYKRHSLYIDFSQLNQWLNGSKEISDELLSKFMVDESCRLTEWSYKLP